MPQIRIGNLQTGSNIGTFEATVNGLTDSVVMGAYKAPATVTGLPRISDAFDTDTLTLDETGLTNISARQWRIVGGANLGTAATQSASGLGNQYVTCDVTADPASTVYTAPPIRVYSTTHMGMAMPASHIEDDRAVLALVPHDEATHIAIASGNWTAVETWRDGKVPAHGARFLIPRSIEVLYNRNDPNIRMDWGRVDGTLKWPRTDSTQMLIENLVATQGGIFDKGRAGDIIPSGVDHEIIISGKYYRSNSFTPTDLADGDITKDPTLVSRGVLCQGECHIWGAVKQPYARATSGVPAGVETLDVTGTGLGWVVGDTINIGGTKSEIIGTNPSVWTSRSEERVLTGVSEAGGVTTLTWSGVLAYPHNNQLAGSTRTDLCPVITLIRGRNISFRSEVTTPEYRRGHRMNMHHMAVVDTFDFQVIDMGRTRSEIHKGRIIDGDEFYYFDNDPEDFGGHQVPLTAQSNIKSRYGDHHHKIGWEEGNIVRRAFLEGSPGWSQVHHDCRVGIYDCVNYKFRGAGLVSEQGSEVGVWARCLSLDAQPIWEGNLQLGLAPKTFEGTAATGGDNNRFGFGYGHASRAVQLFGNISVGCTFGDNFYHRYNFETTPRVTARLDPLRAEVDAQDLNSYTSSAAFPNPTTIDFRDYPLIGVMEHEHIACYNSLFVSKEVPRQAHDLGINFRGWKSWGNIGIGATIEYVYTYIMQDLDLVAGVTADTRAAMEFGGNTYQVIARNLRAEGFQYAVGQYGKTDTLAGADVEFTGHNVHSTNDPRFVQYSIDDVDCTNFLQADVPSFNKLYLNNTTGMANGVTVTQASTGASGAVTAVENGPGGPSITVGNPVGGIQFDTGDIVRSGVTYNVVAPVVTAISNDAVTYVDEDWEDDNVDISADPTETYPLTIAEWDGSVVTKLITNASGSKLDNLSSVAKLTPKPGTDEIFTSVSNQFPSNFRFNYGFWQYGGDDVLVWPNYISDRITGRPAKVIKMIRITGSRSGTNRGAFDYGTTPIVQSDFHTEVGVNGSVTVDVLAGATGGNGTFIVDAPSAPAIAGLRSGFVEHAKVKVTFSGAGNKDVTITPHLDAAGTEEVYVFIYSQGQFKTVKISVLIGGDEATLEAPVVDTHFTAADHANANTIGVTLLPPPDIGGRRFKLVQYSTDGGATWRRLCNGWVQAVHKVTVESDGTAIANGSYNLRIRYKTNHDYVTSTASGDDAVTVI